MLFSSNTFFTLIRFIEITERAIKVLFRMSFALSCGECVVRSATRNKFSYMNIYVCTYVDSRVCCMYTVYIYAIKRKEGAQPFASSDVCRVGWLLVCFPIINDMAYVQRFISSALSSHETQDQYDVAYIMFHLVCIYM